MLRMLAKLEAFGLSRSLIHTQAFLQLLDLFLAHFHLLMDVFLDAEISGQDALQDSKLFL